MVDRNLRHSLWFCEPQVDRDATSSVFPRVQRSPKCHTATRGAEIKTERSAPYVGLRRTRNSDDAGIQVLPSKLSLLSLEAIENADLSHSFHQEREPHIINASIAVRQH